MNIWAAMKRLNRRFDRWSAHGADKIVANLDGTSSRHTRDAKKHIGVWDLLAKDRGSGEHGYDDTKV